MKRSLLSLIGVLVFLMATTPAAWGQYAPQNPVNPVNPYIKPAYSPYLNLLRPGSNPAINYYGLVRPEIDTRANMLGLAQQAAFNQMGVASLQEGFSGAIQTGHSVGFMTQGRYFMTLSSGTSSAGGTFGTFSTRPNLGAGYGGAPSAPTSPRR